MLSKIIATPMLSPGMKPSPRLSLAFFALGCTLATAPLTDAALPPIPTSAQPRDAAVSAAELRHQIEADWLEQAKRIEQGVVGPVTTESDARGACDGIKDGKYGFHTGHEPNPWWQVDLGAVQPITRIVVYNRLDYAPGLHNADTLRIFTSENGKQWTLRHDNAGKHFGGIDGDKPLEVKFDQNSLITRFVRLQIPSEKPIFFHLDEVEVYGPESQNIALHRRANQSSICQWSTAKALINPGKKGYPTTLFIESGRALAKDLTSRGVDCSKDLQALDALEQRWKSLEQNGSEESRREVYLETRWAVRRLVFSNPLLNFNQLLFVKRFTQQTYPDVCLNHMPWVSKPGGDICVLSAANGSSLAKALAQPADSEFKLRYLLNRALGPGHVHGMDLWWDGSRVVFGYARTPTDEPVEGWLNRSFSYELRRTVEPIHIFEMNTDGTHLRQLTSGEWSDLDPTYAANGDIIFVSERCGTSLQCNEYDKDETSCNLYTMKPDGSGIRRMSANKDGDYLPHALDDGNIAYTRWEYHERSWAFIQSIWIIRPDGTGADAVFKQHFVNPWSLEDTRSIPGSSKLVSIAAGHHTLPVGPIVVVNPAIGINEPKGISSVTPDVRPTESTIQADTVAEGGTHDCGGLYINPWALSERYFLASYTYSNRETDPTGYALYLVDVFGNKELVYRDPDISCFIPMPFRPRTRPPAFPPLVELSKTNAVCILQDATMGSEGTKGKARYLRVAEPIGWPYDNERGGQRYGEDHRYGGPDAARKNLLNWTPIRVLGDYPIESDGSAHFTVPADVAVYFQLLDENRMELRRMRSFVSFQPGEIRSCVGCHESRAISPGAPCDAIAARRPPSEPILPPWGNRPISFLRDVQPVFDRNCVRCHSGLKPAKGLDYSGGLTSHDAEVAGYGYNRAFETIIANGLVSISQARAQDASITPPMAYGSHKSKLLAALSEEQHVKEVHLSAEDKLRLTIWIDANAPYHDLFVNKRPEKKAYDIAGDQGLLKEIIEVNERRCASCHKTTEISRLDWINLRDPEQSLFLQAPLATAENSKCKGAVYRDTTDADYEALLKLVNAAVAKAWENPRRDLQALLDEVKPKVRKAEQTPANAVLHEAKN